MNAGPRNGRILKRVRWSASSTVRRPVGSSTSRVVRAIGGSLAATKNQAVPGYPWAGPTSTQARPNPAQAHGYPWAVSANQSQVRQIAPALVEIEPVTDEELV